MLIISHSLCTLYIKSLTTSVLVLQSPFCDLFLGVFGNCASACQAVDRAPNGWSNTSVLCFSRLISLFVSLLPGHCDVSYCLLDAIEIIEILLMRNHPPAVS